MCSTLGGRRRRHIGARHLCLTLGVPTCRVGADGSELHQPGRTRTSSQARATQVVDQVVLNHHGPHPELESDFELFCEVMPEALGIEA
jgi:hypothetical protein